MAEYREYISALRKCAKEHENENLFTGKIDTTALCNDTAKLLEKKVIERSKIEKAIEEISNLHGEYFAVMDKDYKTTHKRFLEPNEVLEILKRNIGE